MAETENNFPDTESTLATIARLFSLENNLTAIDVLSHAKPRFEWYSHDNWNGGFEIYDLYMAIPLNIYSKIDDKPKLEQGILDKLQSIYQGHTSDHVQSVIITPEISGGEGWREKAKEYVHNAGSTATKDVGENSIVFEPEVFKLPKKPVNENQIAVMMPFAAEYNQTYEAIKKASSSVGLKAVRADDIWKNSTFIQDIFELIYCSKIVIVDFSTRNPNVMYETGIAHTLGRHVIPLTRRIEDIPSDLQHHKALVYLPNIEGLESLCNGLRMRLSTITGREPK